MSRVIVFSAAAVILVAVWLAIGLATLAEVPGALAVCIGSAIASGVLIVLLAIQNKVQKKVSSLGTFLAVVLGFVFPLIAVVFGKPSRPTPPREDAAAEEETRSPTWQGFFKNAAMAQADANGWTVEPQDGSQVVEEWYNPVQTGLSPKVTSFSIAGLKQGRFTISMMEGFGGMPRGLELCSSVEGKTWFPANQYMWWDIIGSGSSVMLRWNDSLAPRVDTTLHLMFNLEAPLTVAVRTRYDNVPPFTPGKAYLHWGKIPTGAPGQLPGRRIDSDIYVTVYKSDRTTIPAADLARCPLIVRLEGRPITVCHEPCLKLTTAGKDNPELIFAHELGYPISIEVVVVSHPPTAL